MYTYMKSNLKGSKFMYEKYNPNVHMVSVIVTVS